MRQRRGDRGAEVGRGELSRQGDGRDRQPATFQPLAEQAAGAGVVDLAMLLGSQQTRTEQALSECSLVTLGSLLDVNAALLIDRFAGLRGKQDFVADEEPAPGAAAYLGGVKVDAHGGRWQVLDLHVLAGDAGFLNIGA